jgi:phage baseplate assembly protein W
MARAGMDATTGRLVQGWDHCVQSIRTLLTTRIGTRLMRRSFGARIAELQDDNATRGALLTFYVAVGDALARHEPGYRLTTLMMTRAGADGAFRLEMTGVYYPRGHLGDWSEGQDVSAATLIGGPA